MSFIFSLLSTVGGLAFLGCLFFTLHRMWRTIAEDQRIVQVVLGFFVWVWAFLWGWQNPDKMGDPRVMPVWTASVGLAVVGWFAGALFA